MAQSGGKRAAISKSKYGRDISDRVPYSEQHDRHLLPGPNRFIIERHVPELFDTPFHHHTSVEINFLEDCQMAYSFSGAVARVNEKRLTLFWGAQPHRVTEVSGVGQITNIYLSLGQVLRWGLPDGLVRALLSGAVISALPGRHGDQAFMQGLWEERMRDEGAWRRVHLDEIATRLRRMGLEGWHTQLEAARQSPLLQADGRTMRHIDGILRFVANNFTRPVTVAEIAEAIALSPSRATTLFAKVMGVSIKKHLTRTRLSHARMLLSETDAKITSIALDSGYRSLSSFYSAFLEANQISPDAYRRKMRS